MVETRHYDLQSVFAAAGEPGRFGKHASQLMELHRRICSLEAPLVLECGVHKGFSSGVLADACERVGGRLVSLDIVDCSDVITSDCWTFIQTDDTDQERVLREAPFLKEGIDLIFIDSWHSLRHVRRQLELWYPYVRQSGWLAFHDVDPTPYMRGQPDDNRDSEIVWRAIWQLVQDFFYANEDDLLLEYHLGDKGMAIMQKLAPMSKLPNFPRRIAPRHVSFYSLARRLRGRN